MSGTVFTLKASLYWINFFKWDSVALITILFYHPIFKISATIPDLSHFYWPNFICKTRGNISNLLEICKKKSICSIKMIVNHGSYVLSAVLKYSSWISKLNLALLKLEFNTLRKAALFSYHKHAYISPNRIFATLQTFNTISIDYSCAALINCPYRPMYQN